MARHAERKATAMRPRVRGDLRATPGGRGAQGRPQVCKIFATAREQQRARLLVDAARGSSV